MSGLAGLWNLDGRPADRAIVFAQAATIAHRGGDHLGVWSEGAAGLACHLGRVTPESAGECQPAVDSFGPVLLFDGRLDNREELLAELTWEGLLSGAPDSGLVLAAWHRWGDGCLTRLQGDFALAVFDPGQQQLILARDPVGCRPLYYWTDRNTLVFASEIKAILAHPDVRTAQNEDLLADFLLLEHLPFDDEGQTFFQGIHAVRPGHRVRVTPGHTGSQQFWDFDPLTQVRYGTYASYAEHLRELLIAAVRRRLRSAHPVAVATSGGLDSSIVLCIADDLRRAGTVNVSLLPLSYTPDDDVASEENQFIGLLESARQLRVQRVPMGGPDQPDALERAMWYSEWPRLDEGWRAQRPMLEAANAQGARTLLTGLWSDQFLFVTGYLADLFMKGAWSEVRRHLDEYTRWFVDADPEYFRARFRRELLVELTPDTFRAWLRPFRTTRARPRNASLFSRELTVRVRRQRPRTRRLPAASAHARSIYQAVRAQSHRLQFEADEKLAASCAIEPLAPFLDREVIAYLMSIPGDVQNRHGVPRALLRDAMRGIVPDAILARRWRNEDRSGAQALHGRSPEAIALEIWSRVFFFDKLGPVSPPALARRTR
jgi:asparagine synthase (glutamine-hydrolysing)